MFLFNLLFFINVIRAEEFAYPWQNIFEHPVSKMYIDNLSLGILKVVALPNLNEVGCMIYPHKSETD